MSTEKDKELENENFEDAFGISDEFDDDEFDIDESDLEDDDILAGFPEPGSSSDNAFSSDTDDDFADVEDVSAEYDDFEDNSFSDEADIENSDFEEDDFEEDDFEDSDLEEDEDFTDEDFEDDDANVNAVIPEKSNKIAKMAFYLGTVAILGGIGFVGVNTFMPNLLGSSPAPVSSAVPNPVINSKPPVPSVNSGIVVGNTPPTPSAINQSIEIQKPNQSNAPELVNIRPNLSGLGNEVQAPNNSMSIGQVSGNTSNMSPNYQAPIVNQTSVTPDNNLFTLFENKIDNEITDISASISDIKAMFVETMNSIGSLEKNFVTKQDLDGSVRAIVSSLLPKLDQNNSNPNFVNIIADLKTEIEALSSRIDNQSSNQNTVQIVDNTSEIDDLTQELSLIRKEVSSLQNQLVSSEDTVKALQAVIDKQNKELSDSKKSVAKVRSEAKKRQDAVNAIGGSIVPPSKPSVISNYRLAGVSRNTAWIESSSGTMRVNVGQTIPGLGLIEAIVPADGNWSLVTESGIIIP